MRLNVGCGNWPLPGWINLDERDQPNGVSLLSHVPSLPFVDASLDEIYAGHFVEHLERDQAAEFMRECARCLKPGGRLGVVVPDTRKIMEHYVNGPPMVVESPVIKGHQVGAWVDTDNLDDICALFLYSTLQDSHHQWSYDLKTLWALLQTGGFRLEQEINRWFDPRVPVGAWYQCGWNAIKEA